MTAGAARGRWRVAAGAAIAVALGAAGCVVTPEAFLRELDGGLGPIGTGGVTVIDGTGGSGSGGMFLPPGTGGGPAASGGSSPPGSGGAGGSRGTGGAGPVGTGGRPGTGGGAPGSGGRVASSGGAVGTGGRVGTGGAVGSGGRIGSGGAPPGTGGAAPGSGGTPPGSGGAGPVTACPPGVFCDDFEKDMLNVVPADWTRVGGTEGDWKVINDGTFVLAQGVSLSTTIRGCTPNAAPSAAGATTVSGKVKPTVSGTGSTSASAMLCVRFVDRDNLYCLSVEAAPAPQVRFRTRFNAGETAASDGPPVAMAIATGTSYSVRVSVDAAGALTGSVNGTALPAFTPPSAVASGTIAVATQNAEASFDDIVVSHP